MADETSQQHPLDLYVQWTGLDFEALGVKPSYEKATCDTCGRTGLPVHRKTQTNRCAACFGIRKGYVLSGNAKLGRDLQMTLGTGDFAIVSEAEAIFHTTLRMPEGSRVITRPALKGEGLYHLTANLIKNPPKKDFLFIHFGKPTNTQNFRMNKAGEEAEMLHTSGDTSFGGRNIAAIKSWLVRHLQTNYPDVTAKDWDKIIAASKDLFASRSDDKANKAAETQRLWREKYPDMFRRLPDYRSIEHRMLELTETA